MEDHEIISKATEYLRSHNILTMATASLEGEPDATALEYVNKGCVVYVTVRPDSIKVKNIEENPRVFYEVHEDIPITMESIKKLEAIQVAATAKVISHNHQEFDRIFALMVQKFPIFEKISHDTRLILKFSPKKLWYLNYREKLFHRDEVSFPS